MLKKNKLLGVGITNETTDSILEHMLKRLDSRLEDGKKLFVVTPNPEILVYAEKHPKYKDILNDAEVALPDGVGVFVVLGLMGNKLKERIPGVDFIDELCLACREKPLSMGFLGGGPGIAVKAVECLREKYPWIKVAFVGEEWDEAAVGTSLPQIEEEQRAKSKEQRATIDILFVAFGAPKQEEWIHANLDKLPVKAAMGVGGAFDYISGRVVRAPFMIRAIGFEWLFRLVREPWRWRRQLALFEFIWLVIVRPEK